ncbi:MAG: SPOR domain-containing protein [Acidobacteriota bacterium]|nr:SPOR domain-containing protein [Acidobacteriota bacterium]
MKIICPQCQLQGEIANAPAAFKTRVACARCATTFLVSVVNDEALIMPAKTTATTPPANAPTSPQVSLAEMPRPASLRERLALAGEPATTTIRHSRSAPELSAAAAINAAPPAMESSFSPEALAPPPNPPLPAATGNPVDAYGVGARVLRVSPLWLLAGGVAAVVFVVFCNWLFRSGTLPRNDAAVNLSHARATARDAASANNYALQRDIQLNTLPVNIANDDAAPADDSLDDIALTTQSATPDNASSATAPAGHAANAFTVQLGAFNKSEEAEALITQLDAAGFTARLDRQPARKNKTWYRVQSGLFATHDEAAAYGKQLLAQKAISTFIIAEVEAQ